MNNHSQLTMNIQETIKELRKNQILDAAIEVISERGFERTTIKQIAKQAGVADGTIYNYFTNKAAIMTAIVARMTEAERRDIDFAQAENADFVTFMRSYMPQRIAEIEQELPALKVVLAETLNNAAFRDDVNERIYTPLFALAETYVETLIAQGQVTFADAKTVTRLVAAPVFGMLLLRLMGDQEVADNWSAYGQHVTTLIERALHNSAESSST